MISAVIAFLLIPLIILTVFGRASKKMIANMTMYKKVAIRLGNRPKKPKDVLIFPRLH
jgi:hypothetical protein